MWSLKLPKNFGVSISTWNHGIDWILPGDSNGGNLHVCLFSLGFFWPWLDKSCRSRVIVPFLFFGLMQGVPSLRESRTNPYSASHSLVYAYIWLLCDCLLVINELQLNMNVNSLMCEKWSFMFTVCHVVSHLKYNATHQFYLLMLFLKALTKESHWLKEK